MINTMFLSASGSSGLMSFGIIIFTFILMYFLILAPQKKKDKEAAAMRSGLEIGDEVLTQGGIIGTVVSLKEDTLLIETGSDRVKLRVARWAVAQNISQEEAKAAARAAAKAAKDAEKDKNSKKK